MVSKLWNEFEKGNFSSLYLLYGTESFLINETKQKLTMHALSPEEMDFNFASFDLQEVPIEVALEDAETFPFMGERRVVLLHNPVFLTAEKTKEKIEHNLDKLQQYLGSPAPYSILVFVAPYEKLDERKKITKALKNSATVLEAKKLSEYEIKTWIRERSALSGVQIDEDAVVTLLTLSGTNLMMLTSEIDKLALFAYETKRITAEMVDQLVARSLEQNVFSLVEKVIHNQTQEALRIYYDLLKQNEEPIKILAILAGQFRLIYQVKELSRKGYGQQKIATFLRVHPFRVKLAAGQAKSFSDEQLSKIMLLLSEGDFDMKTGRRSKELIVELFLLKIHGE
ncbi:DNA polymerase III subunit delta [Bacillus sp. 2205SS5-2]|uniref:DNA polymerase III subunit delta n=1 Tax=Bacillus sp. 2205SS5-2 TaxID=3109031 RepID=UPI00300599A9